MKTTKTYITFGVQYKQVPTSMEERHPQGMFGSGYATIEAPDRESARGIAVALFDGRYAFDYEEKPRDHYVPDGEILRVAVLQRNQLQQMRELLAEAYAAADGVSNDEEIDVLVALRDVVAEMLGFEP